MKRSKFSRSLTLVVTLLCIILLLGSMGCQKTPTGPNNSGSNNGNGGNNGNNGGGDDGYAVVTIWTAVEDFDGIRIYIDDEFVGTLNAIDDEPDCGDEQSGVVTVDLEPGTHEAYVQLGSDQSEPEDYELDASTCYLYEIIQDSGVRSGLPYVNLRSSLR